MIETIAVIMDFRLFYTKIVRTSQELVHTTLITLVAQVPLILPRYKGTQD
jgi:hypothetical protein